MRDPRTRLKAIAREQDRDWFRIQNKGKKSARIDLLDEIGYWGTSAADMVDALKDLDVETIELHINSPGGEVWDGITIYNALRDHDARIVVTVDGIAASAASFIAMAGDEVIMNRNSEMMIHDPSGICWGNAADMRHMAKRLDTMADNVASIYAERAGGSTKEWRTAMEDETWYSAQEAVDAKLADKVAAGKDDDDAAKNRFDLSVFNHAGRADAPPPVINRSDRTNGAGRYPGISSNSSPRNVVFDTKDGSSPATFSTNTQEDQLTADQLQKLGLPEDATQEQIDERLDALAALESTSGGDGGDGDGGEGGNGTPPADPPAETTAPSGEVVPGTQPENTPSAEATNRAMNSVPEGVSMIDTARLEALEANAEYVNTLREEQRVTKRDELITNAIAQGKFPPDRKAHWANLYDKDPQGTEDFITNKLAAGAVPLEEIGHGKDSAIENKADEAYSSDFFPHLQAQGAAQ